jgi:ring-1,2-phenylacetyl-CoA epoxidase subunit PaaE
MHVLRVAEVEPLTGDAVAITFQVPPHLRDDYVFRAGQHVTVARGPGAGDVRRSYSICAPASSAQLRIGVRRIPDGVMSTHLTTEVRAGDELCVLTPTGRFGPRAAEGPGHYGAIAAGSGITPILSIAATALDDPRSEVTLVYGNRTRASTMFLAELEALKDRHPTRLRVHHMRSREPIGDPVCRGRIDARRLDALLRRSIDAGSIDDWYVCGPEGMIADAYTALARHRVPAEQIHVERFRASGADPTAQVGAP